MQYCMKRGLVSAVVLAMVFLFAPVSAYAAAGGLPKQVQQLGVVVGDLSDKVDGLAATVDALAAAASNGTPIQLRLRGLFTDGDINASETILGPMSFTAPEGQSMLIKFVTCEATRGVNDTTQFDVTLDADFNFTSSSGFAPLVQFVPTSVWQSPGPFGDRSVASTDTHAYLNIPSPAAGAPEIGDLLLLRAQRNDTVGSGGVSCTVSGVLFPRPAP